MSKRLPSYANLNFDIYRTDGTLIRKTIDKHIISATNYVTMAYIYSEYKPSTKTWGKPKVRIQKYKKAMSAWNEHSGVTIPTSKFAAALIQFLGAAIDSLPRTTTPEKENVNEQSSHR